MLGKESLPRRKKKGNIFKSIFSKGGKRSFPRRGEKVYFCIGKEKKPSMKKGKADFPEKKVKSTFP